MTKKLTLKQLGYAIKVNKTYIKVFKYSSFITGVQFNHLAILEG